MYKIATAGYFKLIILSSLFAASNFTQHCLFSAYKALQLLMRYKWNKEPQLGFGSYKLVQVLSALIYFSYFFISSISIITILHPAMLVHCQQKPSRGSKGCQGGTNEVSELFCLDI